MFDWLNKWIDSEVFAPAEEISEPVISVIKSLEDGWWSFDEEVTKIPEYCYLANHGYMFTHTATHEWLGNKLSYSVTGANVKSKNSWMNTVENVAVGEAISSARLKYNQQRELRKKMLREEQRQRSFKQQRESFMNLVGFDLKV